MACRFCILIAAVWVLAGCNQATQEDAQYDDSRNPYYKQAQQDLDNDKPTAAAEDYETALSINPRLSGAQYQLGILYGEKLQDPVSSIFHFRRYLMLAPNADHAANAKEKIDRETQALAASTPGTTAQNSDELAKLQADNASLQKQVQDATQTISQLQDRLAQATAAAQTKPQVAEAGSPLPPPAPPVTTAPPAGPLRALPLDATNVIATASGPGAAVPDAEPHRSYTVVKGDSIWRIAHKMYPGDTKNGVDKIQDANKDAIGGRPLKIGQVLIIPQ
jgi:LysM repeat protein